MKYKITKPPETEPITLEEAKKYLRVPHDEDDSLIELNISQARQAVESSQNRAIAKQTIRQFLDKFPNDNQPIILAKPPLKELKSFKLNGEEYNDYVLDDKQEPALIYPKNEWTEIETKPNIIELEFEAGYEKEEIPKTTIAAMYQFLAHFYEVRGIVIDSQVNEIQYTVDWLIQKDRIDPRLFNSG